MTSLRLDILLKPLLSPKLIPALISMIVILLSHFALSMIPYCLPFLSINSMLAVAALVMVSTHALTGLLRRFLGLRASATAMVFSHILFIWGFHYAVIRKDIQATSGANGEMLKSNFPGNFVISTLHFSFLQVLWQVPFLTWHMYCICYNIKTEEWVNWNKYPEFQLAIHSQQATRFVNPYNQGILSNFREYCTVHTKDLAV